MCRSFLWRVKQIDYLELLLIDRVTKGIRSGGMGWFARAVGHRLFPPRPTMTKEVLSAIGNGAGIEIGGPSRLFAVKQLLPIYPVPTRIDNVNFSTVTPWEASLSDGGEFRFDPVKPPGTQWIREATALIGLESNSYDFVLSSHSLEHVANPLAALHEWNRVTRQDGHLVLLLPDPKYTFDHRRPITSLAHLRDDYAKQIGEDDVTHLTEILALHDLDRDPGAGSKEQFEARARDNFRNRCLHHHVFNLELVKAMLEETGWRVLGLEKVRPIHLLAFAQKV